MQASEGIRPFEQSDFEAVDRIRAMAFKPIFASFRQLVGDEIAPIAIAKDETGQADYLKGICAPEATMEIYVYERDSEIVGFCALSLDRENLIGEIDLNAVHPDHQGQGVASALYAFAFERMREAGMKVATVGTGADESHAPARRAYERCGFDRSIPGVHYYRRL